ncbi:MAG: hypothetical protein CML66_15155 [Rhodobacteraceae bacterium]|nr:hypothetical protein [Paracoccaceae bacterium]MAY45895.1 hypothetical protein [Paracoccaceae bacterium]
MAFDEHWTTERHFWLDGPEFHHSHMAEAACMVLPAPVGILSGSAITETLTGAPRWAEVDFQDQAETVSADTVVLAYKATGQREGSDPYTAYCSSTYVRGKGGWELLSHQQTPA